MENTFEPMSSILESESFQKLLLKKDESTTLNRDSNTQENSENEQIALQKPPLSTEEIAALEQAKRDLYAATITELIMGIRMAYGLPELDTKYELPNHTAVWVDSLYGIVPENRLFDLYKKAKKRKTELGNTYAVTAIDIEAEYRSEGHTSPLYIPRGFDDPLYDCTKCDFSEGYLHLDIFIGGKNAKPIRYNVILSRIKTIDGRDALVPLKCDHKSNYDLRPMYFVNHLDYEQQQKLKLPYDEYVQKYPDFDRPIRQ